MWRTALPAAHGSPWMERHAGFDYIFSPGAAMNSNKVKIFASGAKNDAAFPELAVGAYVSRTRRDTIRFYGIFKRNSAGESFW